MGNYVNRLLSMIEGSPTLADTKDGPGNPWHKKDGRFGQNDSGASVWSSPNKPGDQYAAYPNKNRSKAKPWPASKAKGIAKCGRLDRSRICKVVGKIGQAAIRKKSKKKGAAASGQSAQSNP